MAFFKGTAPYVPKILLIVARRKIKNMSAGRQTIPQNKKLLSALTNQHLSSFILVGVVRLELTASASRTQRATNCAIPRRQRIIL